MSVKLTTFYQNVRRKLPKEKSIKLKKQIFQKIKTKDQLAIIACNP